MGKKLGDLTEEELKKLLNNVQNIKRKSKNFKRLTKNFRDKKCRNKT